MAQAGNSYYCEMSRSHLAMEKVDYLASLPPTYDAASYIPGGAVADPFTEADAKILEQRAAAIKKCEIHYANKDKKH